MFDNVTCFPYFLSTLSFPETSVPAKFLTTHFFSCHIPFRHFPARLGHPVKRDQGRGRDSNSREDCLPYGSVDRKWEGTYIQWWKRYWSVLTTLPGWGPDRSGTLLLREVWWLVTISPSCLPKHFTHHFHTQTQPGPRHTWGACIPYLGSLLKAASKEPYVLTLVLCRGKISSRSLCPAKCNYRVFNFCFSKIKAEVFFSSSLAHCSASLQQWEHKDCFKFPRSGVFTFYLVSHSHWEVLVLELHSS